MPIAPFGTWESPISAELIASKSITFFNIVADGEFIYCVEMRPNENGRYAIVRYSTTGEKLTVLPGPFSARTRVHEYGGKSFTVADGVIYFVNYADQNLYKIIDNQQPEQITFDGIRFAELTITEHGIIAIAERHIDESREAENFLALIDPDTGAITELATGYDFYAAPAIYNNKKIAWICWNHPNMPWNATHLWVADIVDGKLANNYQLQANSSPQSYFQPQWDAQGNLCFISDLTGWWNFYKWSSATDTIKTLCTLDAEFGQPLWQLGMSRWGWYHDLILCVYTEQGSAKLGLLDPHKAQQNLRTLDLPFTSFDYLCMHNNRAYFIGASPIQAASLIEYVPNNICRVLAESTDIIVADEYISIPKHITFPTTGRQKNAHAFFYMPVNKDFNAPVGEKPPLVVFIHGGPTSATSSAFNLQKQYWTSRGFAVADINYGGSAGYGTKYRNSLERDNEDSPGYWGDVDIKDCVACVKYLASNDLIDPDKAVIRGGSAGGFTTLAALAFTNTFKAGANYYGVSDIMALTKDTHKFESRYMDRLVGALPKYADLYATRSPINNLDNFSAPLIVFQGDEDKVVPENQSATMVHALRERGILVSYVLYHGEQHGFRKAETIIDSLTKELDFYLNTVVRLKVE